MAATKTGVFSKVSGAAVADFAERVGATFAETFLALLVADSTGVVQLTDVKVAAVAAGLAAAKYALLKLQAFTGN